MDVVSEIFEASSLFVEDYSTTESGTNKDKNTIISKYLESRLNAKANKIPRDFEEGLDWINVNKSLSFSSELKGKVVVLDFFTYCCINCMHILPQLKALENEFSVEDGLVVIGVHSPKFSNEHSTANVEAAVRRYEICHPVVNDHEEYLWNALGICCWPTLVVTGPNGELLLYLMGESHEKLLHSFVKETISLLKARGVISSHAIQGIGVDNKFKNPQPLYFPGKVSAIKTSSGCLIAVSDTGHHRVLVIDGKGEIQDVIGGNKSGFEDGSFEAARFHAPQGLVFTDLSTLYVADTENHAIRKVDLKGRCVETVVGDGTQGEDREGGGLGRAQRLSSPWDVAALNTEVLLVAMAGSHQIWAYFLRDTTFWRKKQYAVGSCAAVAGSGREENRNNAYPQNAGFAQPSGLAVVIDRQTIYVADSESSTVRAISTVDGKVTALVGGLQDPQNLFAFGDVDGCGTEARLQHPLGVTWSQHKQSLYVCDSYNHKIKVVNPSSRYCSTLAGSALSLNEPGGLCALDNLLYVADTNNHCLKVINLDNNTVEMMSIKSKKRELKENKNVLPVKEVDVSMNCGGGILELSVSVQVAADIKPLPESPPVWTLTLPEGWKSTELQEQEDISKHWTLTVPPSKPHTTCHLRLQCRLFFCHDNLCSARVLPFLVNLKYEDDAPKQVLCPLQFLFSL